MSRLARDYGISVNGLAKICTRLTVPYPPCGYWAKKVAGKKVVQYRLPEREADTPASIAITPTPAAFSTGVVARDSQINRHCPKHGVRCVRTGSLGPTSSNHCSLVERA